MDLGCELQFSLVTRERCRQNRVCLSSDFVVGTGRVSGMSRRNEKVHVAKVRRAHVTGSGEKRCYESVYLRRTFRQGGKVCNETVANLSMLPAETITAIEATLKGQTLVAAGSEFDTIGSLPHGDVAAVAVMARTLGMAALLGPACRSRDLVLGLIISRVIRPASKLDTLSWWADSTLGTDLGITGLEISPGCECSRDVSG